MRIYKILKLNVTIIFASDDSLQMKISISFGIYVKYKLFSTFYSNDDLVMCHLNCFVY